MAVGQSVPNSTVPFRSSLPDHSCALDLGKKLEDPGLILLILSHAPVLLFLLKEKAAFFHSGVTHIQHWAMLPTLSTLSGHSRDNSEGQIRVPIALIEGFWTAATGHNAERRDSITSV